MTSSSHPYLQSLEFAPDAGISVWLDKRKSPRVQYCAAVPVNANNVGGLPPAEQFESVETRDLSQKGLSFYAAKAPEDRPIILQMGAASDPVFMLARVTRCERDYDDPQRRFIVGCEFVGRVKLTRGT